MSTSEAPNADQAKQTDPGNWSDRAASWIKWHDRVTVMGHATTEALMRAAAVTQGMEVLDLASGAGVPALSLAVAVGPNGHVTATDLMPEMVAAAEKNAREKGLSNITFRQADAENLPFGPDV